MRKKREFNEGAFYHVTSRTNDRIRVFERKLGRKIMLLTLENAKEKFNFTLTNFCIMPTHIHLLIRPENGDSLSRIMQWIKTNSAKSWNFIHGSTDHLWGARFYAREIKTSQEYDFVMNYIDQNPVVVGLAPVPEEWKASGAFYKANNIEGLVDYGLFEQKRYIKYLTPVPAAVSKLIPPAQLEKVLKNLGVYSEEIVNICKIVSAIPKLSRSNTIKKLPVYLRYYTGTADYFISEYDGEDTMYGEIRLNVYPHENEYKEFKLSGLMKNENLKLDFSWEVSDTFQKPSVGEAFPLRYAG